MSIHRVLVVDDDSLSREFLYEAVGALGLDVDSVESGRAALERIAERNYDLVLSDMRMPAMDGMQLLAELRERRPELPVVMVTAHGSIETAVEAIRLGAADFLLKPCTPDTLEMVIRRVAEKGRLMAENAYLRSELVGKESEAVIARSPRMLETLRSATRIARSKGTVLITGESGTGKERVAHHIHMNSPRCDGPFIQVNCAALSEQLLESELFGHERGAFTGAHRAKPGRFELADGGTLLLDEIGEISPKLQAKLLRVLEEEEFERVGGTTTMRVDVRVIATTNRNLPDEIAEGNFREDLYYRLHVLPLELAALRHRAEDVMPLAEHFAERYARQNGRPTPGFDAEATQRLTTWSWPGNVRELENTIQRAIVMLSGDTIGAEDLAFGPASSRPASQQTEESNLDPEEALADLIANRRMADVERVAILATLECTKGNKTEAARRLGLTARTLSNKMKIWKAEGIVA
ncbi:MAG: sigma-54-dependent Fis family transcriptional regulator [Planctomycetes bacterium]|nr:sigma-54-dependent Fis family transcriptional regulator [Planctomycetota bacterium]MCB9905047.1 sigma-54-dependent Fis family transcriptional regulator [Planctomycetota bacterium]